MKNSKNRKSYRMIAMLLILTLLSTVALTGTFAKYTSTFKGSDTALVAKWDINVESGGNDITETLDLFKHAYTANLVDGAGNDKIISPGVAGSFDLVVKNNSDVAAKITLDLEESKLSENLPIVYSIKDSDAAINNLNDLQETLSEMFGTLGAGTNKKVTVNWAWAFEYDDPDVTEQKILERDASDTALGKASYDLDLNKRSEYTLDITVTADQAKPE